MITTLIRKKYVPPFGIGILPVVVLFMFQAVSSPKLFAAQDSRGLLKSVAAKIASTPAVEIGFSFSALSPDGRVVNSQDATVVSGGSAYKMVASDTEIYCDGKTRWIYNVAADELMIFSVEPQKDGVVDPSNNPLGIFSGGGEGFTFPKSPTVKTVGGKEIYIIEMAPSQKRAPYKKIVVSLYKQSREPYSIEYLSKDGTKYSVKVTRFTPLLQSPPMQSFVFPAHRMEGLEVVDLRR